MKHIQLCWNDKVTGKINIYWVFDVGLLVSNTEKCGGILIILFVRLNLYLNLHLNTCIWIYTAQITIKSWLCATVEAKSVESNIAITEKNADSTPDFHLLLSQGLLQKHFSCWQGRAVLHQSEFGYWLPINVFPNQDSLPASSSPFQSR